LLWLEPPQENGGAKKGGPKNLKIQPLIFIFTFWHFFGCILGDPICIFLTTLRMPPCLNTQQFSKFKVLILSYWTPGPFQRKTASPRENRGFFVTLSGRGLKILKPSVPNTLAF